VIQDLPDHHRILDAGDDPDGPTAGLAGLNVDIEHPLQALRPGQGGASFGRRWRIIRSAGLVALGSLNLFTVIQLLNGYIPEMIAHLVYRWR
jgi:hypothetical protein